MAYKAQSPGKLAQHSEALGFRRKRRMCYWKQWRYARTKVRELLKLGTYLRTAIFVAISRKGPWHLARTQATQTGMIPMESGLKDQGLLSVKELWVNIHYSRPMAG
ncbi:MAG: hypothetical protein AB1512_30285 [Thermodesulfobacteriota bacterium]